MVEREIIDYKDSNGDSLRGVLFSKRGAADASQSPAIIVFHAFEGITPFEEEQARRLNEKGCVAFCADVYGIENRADDVKGWFAVLNRTKDNRTGLMRRHLLAAIDYVKSLSFVDSTKIGAIGFCFGGLCVLDLARMNCGLSAVASFHGVFTPLPDQPEPKELPKIETTVLVCHGDLDLHVTQQTWLALIEELRSRNADWYFINHGRAKHSFTHPQSDLRNAPGVGYNKEAAELSWAAMLDVFRQKQILPANN